LFSFISFIQFVIGIAYLFLLIAGAILCKKYAFRLGLYFFLFMIMAQIYRYLSQFFISSFFDRVRDDHSMGMSIGEWAILLALIPSLIEVVAFSLLVVGLYQMWNRRHAPTSEKSMD